MSEDKILGFLPQMHFPGVVYIGKNSLFYFKTLQNKKILALVSKSVWEKHQERLERSLPNCDFRFSHGEPKKSDMESLHKEIQKKGYTHVIGIGGGSVMDLAKTARLEKNTEVIVVPTTSGTGAEVSRSAVISEGDEKKPIVSEKLVPNVVLLDPSFTLTLSKFKTAYTMVDALIGSIEGLVSRTSNPLSEGMALLAIDRIIPNLRLACENPDDVKARENLQLAGFLSGLVQGSSSVGLVHSFAHYFGGKMRLPHGLAIGTFTLPVIKHGMEKTDRFQKLQASQYLNRDLLSDLTKFLRDIDLYEYHKKLDFGEIDVKEACERIRSDVCTTTNPYPVTDDDVKGILSKMEVI